MMISFYLYFIFPANLFGIDMAEGDYASLLCIEHNESINEQI